MDAMISEPVPMKGGDPSGSDDRRSLWTARFVKLGISPEHAEAFCDELLSSRMTPLAWLRRKRDEKRIDEPSFLSLVADLLSMTIVDAIAPSDVSEDFVRAIPIRFVRQHNVIGLKPVAGVMTVLTDDPHDPAVMDHIGAVLNIPVRIELARSAVVLQALHVAYAEQNPDFEVMLDEANQESRKGPQIDYHEDGDLLDSASRAPVIKLVNMILSEAVKRLASDVHIQPFPKHVQTRFRIDGVLYDVLEIPPHLLDEVVSRIKVIGKMDIAEKRVAQDGRTTVTVGERSIDLRISIIPTCYGERVVLRLLDKSARLYALPELGMSASDRTRFETMIARTHGIILVTGPTGSGKSTTLYAALRHLDCRERNIITLEDPIEYQIPGISQVQVSTKKGMSFATGLRSVLRQDPDIIMVGEIRDEETARMAIQSSLTGHLVFSTLHTNNAAGAVSRLLDLGIEPYLVASSLLASLAQRLIRRVCSHCCGASEISQEDVKLLQLDPSLLGAEIVRPRGCDRCSMTGYRGRQGVFELLCVNEPIQELISQRSKSGSIEKTAMDEGMKTLRLDAIRKLLARETTIEEISRVTQSDGWAGETINHSNPHELPVESHHNRLTN